MDSTILISVIVPAYNVEQWLSRCLDSILAQTYPNLEILVINDGSTDDTPAIADHFAKKDPRIRVIHQMNRGLIEVRERGIQEAKGQFVGFVDGDDEVAPDMYGRLLENALKYDAQISQCGILYCFYDGRKKPVGEIKELLVLDREEGLIKLLEGDQMEPSLCNKIYKRELLPDSCPDKTLINNEDLLRNSVIFGRAERSVMDGFCGYFYWRRSGSMSNNSQAVRIAENILKVRRLILDQAKGNVRKAAEKLYITGLINTYNKLVGRKDPEARALQKRCQKELRFYIRKDSSISVSTRMRIRALCTVPGIYSALYSIHRKRMYAGIRKEANALQRADQ